MKKLLLLLLFIFPVFCFSQVKIEIPQEFVNSQVGNSTKGIKFKGSPYLNEVFVKGEIIVNDSNTTFITKIRYNAYSEVFELQDGSNKKTALNKNKTVSVFMGKQHFAIYSFLEDNKLKEGYLEILNSEGKMMLYKQYKKKFIDVIKAQSGYSEDKPAKFVLESPVFYIQKNKSDPLEEISLKKKSILNIFSDNKPAINNYVKKHKLNLKKQEDVVVLFDFYNALN